MLAIRMQRTGRSGHAQFRVIVQDSRFNPAREKVVAYVGTYDPHTKAAALDGQRISHYLEHGAQPSDTVARLLKKEGIKLPSWVKLSKPQKRTVKNPDKRRSTRPATPKVPAAEPAAEETPPETAAENETPAEPVADEQTPAEETPAPEAPAEEASTVELVAEEPNQP